jgi:hypothetical protein
MASSSREWTLDEIMQVAMRSAGTSHLCGCVMILVFLGAKGLAPQEFFIVLLVMVSTVSVPVIVAGYVAEIVYRIFRRMLIPIPLFTSTCVVLTEAALFGWVIVMIEVVTAIGRP